MRAIAIVLLLNVAAVAAQNWALLNPAYKYNYSLGGTDTITNQIFVTHIDTVGVDSLHFQISRTSAYCDTCLTGTGGVPACDGCYIWQNAPEFLGVAVIATTDEWILIGADSSILIPNAGVGSSWLYSSLGGITAQVVSADTLTIWGTMDSVKFIGLSGNDTIVLSKDHGILNFPGPGAQLNMMLLGIEGAGVGIIKPTFQEFFPYQPGDVLEYVAYTGGIDGIGGGYGSGAHFKLNITSVTDYGDSLILDVDPICIGWSAGGWGFVSCDGYMSGVYQVTRNELPYLSIVNAQPHQLILPEIGINPLEEESCIAKHYVDSTGRYNINTYWHSSVDPWHRHQAFLSTTPTSIPDLFVYGQADDGVQTDTYGLHYVEGIGLVSYDVTLFESWRGYILQGAVIGGDTIGTVMTDSALIAMSVQHTQQEDRIFIYPNPASDHATLDMGGTPIRSWRIVDISGRMICGAEIQDGPAKTDISLGELTQGAYVIIVHTDAGQYRQRFLVVR